MQSNKGNLDSSLKIIWNGPNDPITEIKTFKIVGADVTQEVYEFETHPRFKRCVVVTRNGNLCENLEEIRSKRKIS